MTRHRVQLQGDRTRDAARLEKLLVASNITGASSRAMLGALVAGERDPAVMAEL